ncbi:MAG TPA: pyruvate kinase [Gammaproteobacteria bacterium]|nr:pyruvate kinase [Gammaproteobacteria bacterium]
MRRTKIVVTLGPATDDPAVLAEILRAGANVVRVNFSHGTADDVERRVALVRNVAAGLGRDVGILGDLRGPKIRTRRFADGSIELSRGDRFVLDVSLGEDAGTAAGVGVTYPQLAQDVSAGDTLLLDDGHIVLDVEAVEGPRVICRVTAGGRLSNAKGINRQGGGLSAAALTEKDREDIRTAAALELDYLAVSFPREAADIELARRLFREVGGEGRIVAKIERAEAVQNIESIIDASDVIMVARGDLGVEVGYAELTGLQKRIIRLTRTHNRIVITATQMMESMVNSPIPTRAEVSDVANAVMDGSDAVMLSGETAIGRYPVKAVEAMAEVCRGAEKHHLPRGRSSHRMDDSFRYIDEAIAMAVMYTANHLNVSAIIALTESGSTALWMSRIRSDIPIFAFTRHEATRRRVTLYRGVYPVPFDIVHTEAQLVYQAVFDQLLDLELVNVGDLVVFTKGDLKGVAGGTNAMKILKVTDGR